LHFAKNAFERITGWLSSSSHRKFTERMVHYQIDFKTMVHEYMIRRSDLPQVIPGIMLIRVPHITHI
jgi:hypothetical protein